MQPNEIIRRARERAGLSLANVAEMLGTTPEHVRDIEDYTDEMDLTVSVAECIELLDRLEIGTAELVGSEAGSAKTDLSLAGFVEVLRQLHASESEHGRDLEEVVGYEIAGVFSAPSRIYQWNLDLLKNVCAKLGMRVADVLNMLIAERRAGSSEIPG